MSRSPLRPALCVLATILVAWLAGPNAHAAPAYSSPVACEATPEPAPPPTDPFGLANLALAEGRAAEAEALFREVALGARARDDAALAVLAEASALRAAVLLERTDGLAGHAGALLGDAAELEPPALAARIELHVARTLIEAMRGDATLIATLAPLANRTLLEVVSGEGAPDGAQLASLAAGNRVELISVAGGPADEAMKEARRALFVAQHDGDADLAFRWLATIGQLQETEGERAAAIATLRRAVAERERVRRLRGPASATAEPLIRRREAAAYETLVGLLLEEAALESTPDEERQALLRESRNLLEATKAAELRDYFRDACLDAHRPLEPDEVPGTLLVYPVPLPDRLELIVSRDGRLSQFTVNVSREELDRTIRRFRLNLEKRTTRQYLREAATLYGWLIAPIEAHLDDPATKDLVFVPSGALRTIPIAALRDGEGRFLVERIGVSVTPVVTLTDSEPVDAERMQLLLAGLSEAVDGFAALPAVRGELDAIAALYDSEPIVDEAFESARLARELQEKPYGVVHIASHGEFRADTRESFLLAYDDKISIDELAAMIGSTRFRTRNVELLTLSACQSAAGDDRAALGLAGLAVRVGARSALATLWNVNDAAAAQLVTRFYAALREPGMTRAEALRRAQLETLKQPGYGHPVYWAAFTLIGSWR